ncbi:MAG: DUF1353 domain-containing protein [Thiohalomonadales bacterium]
MFYKRRRMYKYNLHSDFVYETGIHVEQPKNSGLIAIENMGKLTINRGYSWDGPSGPSIDTKNFMQGSLVHDALYQLLREGILPPHARVRADEILRDICLADGMSKFRAWYVHLAVRIFAAAAAKSDLLEAPSIKNEDGLFVNRI